MAHGKKERSFAGWLVPPLCLAAALAGVGIVLGAPVGLAGGALALLATAPILWVLGSALWPAKAERTCPACRSERIERIDRAATVGIVCRACGWRDESASAWLLAEEEGPLEEIVIAERRSRRARRGGRENGKRSSVDSLRGRD